MIQTARSTAAYVRVSSDKQDVARQEQRIEATGLSIAFWFRDQEGKNPRDLPQKRQAFQQMLKAVQAGLVDTIIVDRQDRFGVADAYQWGKFVSLLREHGATLIDADGKTLSAVDDVTILTGTLGAITSAREQREKAHRNITGKVTKARSGEYQGGYPPYGCDVVCFGADSKEKWRTIYLGHFKRLRVWPDERQERFDGKDNAPAKDPTDRLFIRPSIEKDRIKIVRRIFLWYANEDISPRQIATRLNELGVDSVMGPQWDKVRIHEMLTNPAYIGLPTWNKKGGSRFVEYIGGQFREVQNRKGGRRCAQADFVQPSTPQYRPLIDVETWNKVQAKVRAASEQCRSAPRRSPDTESLFLRPFIYCGQCGKPMHATTGRSTDYLWPSYFCSTYGKYGPKNPTGCHCHRVRHTVLEGILKTYLQETNTKVADALTATETGDWELVKPFVFDLVGARASQMDTASAMMEFIESNGPEIMKEKGALADVYGLLFERLRPKMEKTIKAKETELDRRLDEYRGLSPKLFLLLKVFSGRVVTR